MSNNDTSKLTDSEKLELWTAQFDAGWDAIEDLPEFKLYPEGTYLGRINKGGANMDKGTINIIVAHVKTLEKKNADDPDMEPEDLIGFSYFGAFGLQQIKRDWMPVIQHLQANNPKELVDMLADNEIIFTVGVRTYKDKQTGEMRTSNQLKSVIHAEDPAASAVMEASGHTDEHASAAEPAA